VGRIIEGLHPSVAPIKVGVIGLGAGTLATYGSKGDVYRFYDINPGVIDIAKRDFSYLTDSEATIELPLGDARLSLEREPAQNFDVLAIDAFSSDAIPVHLITKEAVQVYLRHMKPGGVIAFHVTNRYLDLVPVVEGIANDLGLTALYQRPNDPGIRNWRENGYIKRISADPWGNPYQYIFPGTRGQEYDLYSFGADGQEGGEGANADIGNWNLGQ
jgi:type II secretory pathway pseudopilin PulG